MDFRNDSLVGLMKRVQSPLFSIVGVLPVLILLLTGLQYGIYVGMEYFNFPEWTYNVVLILRQFTDISFYTLVLLLITARYYRFISKVSLICLSLLWLLNTIYITFSFEADIYFYLFISIIYATFVILTIRTLINR